tara:strand:+ start:45 stop:572 length:528 start_codon:yes stop_codon:yes gene_type:complete
MIRILEVKKHIGNLSKNAKNPFFKSAYLDLTDLLNAVEPLLQEQSLLLLQPIKDNKVYSQIICTESGDVLIESWIDLPSIQDPQKLGSAITYFRRYTLKSLLAIAEGDDDGNLAAKPEKVKPPKPTAKPVLTVDQFEKAKMFSLAQVKKCLDGYDMSIEQREELEQLILDDNGED